MLVSKHDEVGRNDTVSTKREEARWEQVLVARADDAARQVASVRRRAEAGKTPDGAALGVRLRKHTSELAAAQRGLEEWRAG
jgi:hypothetical protein